MHHSFCLVSCDFRLLSNDVKNCRVIKSVRMLKSALSCFQVSVAQRGSRSLIGPLEIPAFMLPDKSWIT